ncbi:MULTISPECIES: glutathione S-transferase family protein [unclassified Agarivorans]|uniref:glutathione S-transferase family protein n=1 Tax=unclassified Agarivorans TaxID=2636026 RepID=UPI0026E16F21|nr:MULTISPECIES: glutathione S-transferase family protein [unclassified Agarivorans]MDO6685773.1 glutathione S-transferase family protein [Agarivorans sp. 3_MG-2023]MDO6716112.1 glutathione S-transferase family protein [Agarivorans sp. 2_MG-2023]
MGLLVDGKWQDKWYETKENKGRFVRSEAQFRNWVTADGSAGPSGKEGFKAEAGRYHLYVSHACPWANRTMIFRKLKGLEQMIDYSVVHWFMGENGWTFAPGEGVVSDPINQAEFMHQVYTAADANYSGRVTVPVLWDKQQQTIVSNESADIIRMFNSAFDDVGAKAGDYYPEALQVEIEELNQRIYHSVNNGVYRAGFATTQEAYEEALYPLFESLDFVEQILTKKRYLTGKQLTEADWRLFTTLIRFDVVYVGHFKCNLKRIVDYPNIDAYMRELYQIEGIAETINFEHIKRHYYQSHGMVNPTRVVPVGPILYLDNAHQRDHL